MTQTALTLTHPSRALRRKAGDAVLDLVLHIPASREQAVERSELRARSLGRQAARRASLMAASLALPPGLLSWLTILPELIAVWKLQAQLVSDIAAIYGKTAVLGREQMLYCLFKHVSAQLFRDVLVRVGERLVMQQLSQAFFQSTAQTLGVKVAQRVLGNGATRLVPLIGAVGVGAYAYFDTTQVAKTAIELFSKDIVQE